MRGLATAGAVRSDAARSGASLLAVGWLLQVLTAAGLAVDAYIHADLAPNYDPVRQSISQGTLFRIEAGVASGVALLIIAIGGMGGIWGRVGRSARARQTDADGAREQGRRTKTTWLVVAVWALAFLVAASALGAILLYRYVNVGTLGPLPNMYEPIWFPKKTTAAIAEGVATAAALVGLLLAMLRARSLRHL